MVYLLVVSVNVAIIVLSDVIIVPFSTFHLSNPYVNSWFVVLGVATIVSTNSLLNITLIWLDSTTNIDPYATFSTLSTLTLPCSPAIIVNVYLFNSN